MRADGQPTGIPMDSLTTNWATGLWRLDTCMPKMKIWTTLRLLLKAIEQSNIKGVKNA